MMPRVPWPRPDFAPLLATHPYALPFVSVGGSHLYGYATERSDYDLYGVHRVPTRDLLRLRTVPETLEWRTLGADARVDGATHEVRKFIGLLLKANGNALEVLYAPQTLVTTPLHEELRTLARGCVTRRLYGHYLGMAANQQRGMLIRPVKALLHSYRCLAAGIHVLRTGELLVDVYDLSAAVAVPDLRRLADFKRAGQTDSDLTASEVARHRENIAHLEQELRAAESSSRLPPEPTCQPELDNLLLRVRLEQLDEDRGQRP